MFHMWDMSMGWWMLFGGVWMVVFWGGLIALIVWGIKKLVERPGSHSYANEKHRPLGIAEERYTRGEISRGTD